jgi:signal transduction histidine kinase
MHVRRWIPWNEDAALQLEKLWNDFVQNALDAMPQGGTVTITGQRTATQVQLHVQDMGSSKNFPSNTFS